MRPSLRWVPLAWLAACGPQPVGSTSATAGDATSTSGAASTSTTSGEPTTSTGTTSTGTGTPDTSWLPPLPDIPCEVVCTGGFIEPSDLPAPECDIWTQDCPAGQKCMPYSPDGTPTWTAEGCFPVVADPVALDEPCTFEVSLVSGLDDCDVGAMCWDGDGDEQYHCAPLCTGTPDALTCPPNHYCASFSEHLTVCEQPTCDPLQQDCPDPEELCVPNIYAWEDWCLPDDSELDGQLHAPCASETDCDKGLACVWTQFAGVECVGDSGCCEPFCEIGVDTCPGVGQQCAPWFEITDVGVCRLP